MKALPMKANKETKEVAIPIDAEDGSHIPAASPHRTKGRTPIRQMRGLVAQAQPSICESVSAPAVSTTTTGRAAVPTAVPVLTTR